MSAWICDSVVAAASEGVEVTDQDAGGVEGGVGVVGVVQIWKEGLRIGVWGLRL